MSICEKVCFRPHTGNLGMRTYSVGPVSQKYSSSQRSKLIPCALSSRSHKRNLDNKCNVTLFLKFDKAGGTAGFYSTYCPLAQALHVVQLTIVCMEIMFIEKHICILKVRAFFFIFSLTSLYLLVLGI